MDKIRLPDRMLETLATAEDVAMVALAMAVSGVISPLARVKQRIDSARTARELSQADTTPVSSKDS